MQIIDMEQFVEALTCPNCMQYMTSYIYICYSGHSYCQKCRNLEICILCKSDISDIRNVGLEAISKNMCYPCENAFHGCQEFMSAANLKEHLEICDFRSYPCKLSKNCVWKGRRMQLEKHCLDYHSNNVFIGSECTSFWNPEKPEHSINLMLAYNELFYVHRKLKGGIMYWTVQYVGRPQDVILFCFQVDIFTDQFKDRSLKLSDICHDDVKDDIGELTGTGFCAAVPLPILETYTNTQGVIMYKIRIMEA